MFKKWAKIGTRIFDVFKYNITIQIPKTNAENIPPNSWEIPNRNDETKIATVSEKYSLILLKIIPLNNSSSTIGANNITLSNDPAKAILWSPIENVNREYKSGMK